MGATCGIFPIDEDTIRYMELSARDTDRIELVREYSKAQGMWREGGETGDNVTYSDKLELNVSTVEPCISGPKRPQDKILLSQATTAFAKTQKDLNTGSVAADKRVSVDGESYDLGHGDVVIAAITSCTNTSNPYVMVAAGLVAKAAHALGMQVKPWVKTSLAPGSQVVTEYLDKAGLSDDLDALGFNLVGYGCTTCIGNSGPLKAPIEKAIADNDLVACSVLSGNRNFEGRIHQYIKANYLASPPLVVAYALAGSQNIDISKDSLGDDKNGNPVYLKDIWPSNQLVHDTVAKCVTREMFAEKYADVFSGDDLWQGIKTPESQTFTWDNDSTYIQHPPFFTSDTASKNYDVANASMLALLGDSITTDHISPAGGIAKDSPAAAYLASNGVDAKNFNSYGSRRGNHEVMMRGTFANIRIKNEMADGKEGGYTKYIPTGEIMPIYDAAMRYQAEATPLVVIGGKEYGTGSSRDWAAKGTNLLGVKAVVVESFERIHRSNLVGMGVLPLQFTGGVNRTTLTLDGSEKISLTGLSNGLSPAMSVTMIVKKTDGSKQEATLLCRLDTQDEIEYFESGGILQYVMGNLTKAA